MNEQEKVQGNQTERPIEEKKRSKRNVRKTQSQMIQEALGMKPADIADVENKLFITRFLDYFADEPLDFIFKEKNVFLYIVDILLLFNLFFPKLT